MRIYPTDEYDIEDAQRINAQPWQLDMLKRNPSYVFWGIDEDYMVSDKGQWTEPVIKPDWQSFDWKLDELNELVNFYFAVEGNIVACPHCRGSGLNPETDKISSAFYAHDGEGERWCDQITQDEVNHLWEKGRLKGDFKELPTAFEVNQWERTRLGHDAINRWMLVEFRARKLGVYGKCETCQGHGDMVESTVARLSLTMWILHPRKGASRGVKVESIQEAEIPAVLAYLREARDRNAARFGKLDSAHDDSAGGEG